MRALLLIISPFISILALGQGQKVIPKTYEGLNTSPWAFVEGDTLIIETDTVFIVNANRYHFYRNIHQDILQTDDNTCKEILTSYEKRLDDFDSRYQQLAKNSQEANVITLGILEESRAELEETKISLEKSIQDLEESRAGLDEAKSELKKAQRQSNKKAIIAGAVGVGIGLVLGILIAL